MTDDKQAEKKINKFVKAVEEYLDEQDPTTLELLEEWIKLEKAYIKAHEKRQFFDGEKIYAAKNLVKDRINEKETEAWELENLYFGGEE